MLLQYSLSVCGLSSHSLDIDFCKVEVFNFNEVKFIHYFLLQMLHLVLYLQSQYPRSSRFFSYVVFWKFLYFLYLGPLSILSYFFVTDIRSAFRFIFFLHVDGCLVVPALFIENNTFILLNFLCSIFKDQMAILMLVYFQALYCIALVHFFTNPWLY